MTGMPDLLTAIAGAIDHGDPSAAVLEWALDLASKAEPARGDRSRDLAYTIITHPNLPARRAAELCGAVGNTRRLTGHTLAGYLTRPDVPTEHLHLVAALARMHSGSFAKLIDDPRTSSPVLERAAAFAGLVGKWQLLYLQTHPNATADSVAACWVNATRSAPLTAKPADLFAASDALIRPTLERVRAEHLAAAFERVTHPAALLSIAHALPDGPTPAQLHRLATHTVLNPTLLRQARWRKLGKTHVATQVAALIKARGNDPDLVQQCITACRGYTLAGLTPQQAFTKDPVDTRDQLAKASTRNAAAVLRAARADRAAGAALAASLTELASTANPAAALGVFEQLSVDYDGTLAELIEVCRAATTP